MANKRTHRASGANGREAHSPFVPAIAQATNAQAKAAMAEDKAMADGTMAENKAMAGEEMMAGYASIENPDVIEPGWVLCIPSVEDAQMLLSSETAMMAK